MSTTILEKIDQLEPWKREAEEAPHKPLLLLYALGCWHSRRVARLSFQEVERDLLPLLERYGPERASYRPDYPFWRLQNDEIWVVDAPADLSFTASGDPWKSELREMNVQAGFSPEVLSALETTPELVFQIAKRLLDKCFPPALHQEILADVGLVV
jgi:putative restriction endonuclease